MRMCNRCGAPDDGRDHSNCEADIEAAGGDKQQLFEVVTTWVETDAKKLDDLQEKHQLTAEEVARAQGIIDAIRLLRSDIQKRIFKD